MEDSSVILIDETYEFSAPRFYDFINGETEEDVRNAELWFENTDSYAPSPFMLRIRSGRSVQLSSLCDFGNSEQTTKAVTDNGTSNASEELVVSAESNENLNPNLTWEQTSGLAVEQVCSISEQTCEVSSDTITKENGSGPEESTADLKIESGNHEESAASAQGVCTPKPAAVLGKGSFELKKQQTARKIAASLKNPSALKSKMQSHLSHTKSAKPASVRRDISNVKSSIGTPNLAHENHAIKRQKLDGGKSRQILSIKLPNLLHKTRPDATANTSNLCSSTTKTSKDGRKIYVRDGPAPFVSMAEMLKKFQSSTRDLSLPQNSLPQDVGDSSVQGNTKMTLTRPKEPEFETAQRARPVKVKSSAELEEEMMAKMPKFKARPLNKKILEAPTLPPSLKSNPQPPEFREFHLETMERANKNADTFSVFSIESHHQKPKFKAHYLTEPKTPVLQTSLRARPTKVKSSLEIEQEELEKIPKFKARPLNKKIFESKGEMGLFSNTKKQVTIPQEFHFAVDERIPPPWPNVADLFDKLSLNSEPKHEKHIPRNTKPNPFHLHTEERGAEKERKFITELMQKQWEEEQARIPKANPYPYTTDYPVIPPKPKPKECTRPEPFHLESLERHEEEMRREMEERQKKELEESQMRLFKAQPVLKEDPIPLPEKERKPLTQIQEINLHVEHRAVDRAEFDKKIKEKEMMYKRYREEAEAARQMEDEKALKQLRRTLVPHARPVPNFANPFVPQKSCKETTRAKSPKLRVLKRREEKQCLSGSDIIAASTAAAALMR
ncbi:hypothetical protein Cgig2_008886 [Carnegiea gigantea]|uniref:Protein TPX2 n=1 Tax=Carnegiea gigantea TaxID=171969 RepID=A0A9Q1KJU5_9CARY|nr:hypothetical protein Cgig2_008886 [Carnegiea gigantea]